MEKKELTEFELKYIIEYIDDSLSYYIIDLFKLNGFTFIKANQKVNLDEYFDTNDLLFYFSYGSLRIRENDNKFKGTLKIPLNEKFIYMARDEEPITLTTFDAKTLIQTAKLIVPDLKDKHIFMSPILQSKTNRTNFIFEKDETQIQISFDKTIYTNHFLDEIKATDEMIEIEIKKGNQNADILVLIDALITGNIDGLTVNRQSKYERGIEKTVFAYNQTNPNISEFIKLLKLSK